MTPHDSVQLVKEEQVEEEVEATQEKMKIFLTSTMITVTK
jgi:hypothetical protein